MPSKVRKWREFMGIPIYLTMMELFQRVELPDKLLLLSTSIRQRIESIATIIQTPKCWTITYRNSRRKSCSKWTSIAFWCHLHVNHSRVWATEKTLTTLVPMLWCIFVKYSRDWRRSTTFWWRMWKDLKRPRHANCTLTHWNNRISIFKNSCWVQQKSACQTQGIDTIVWHVKRADSAFKAIEFSNDCPPIVLKIWLPWLWRIFSMKQEVTILVNFCCLTKCWWRELGYSTSFIRRQRIPFASQRHTHTTLKVRDPCTVHIRSRSCRQSLNRPNRMKWTMMRSWPRWRNSSCDISRLAKLLDSWAFPTNSHFQKRRRIVRDIEFWAIVLM